MPRRPRTSAGARLAAAVAALGLAAACSGPPGQVAGPARLASADGPAAIQPDVEPPAAAPHDPGVAVPAGPVHQPSCTPDMARLPTTPAAPKPPPRYLDLVPEDRVPEPGPPPAERVTDLRAVSGKAMWVWQWNRTEGGDPAAVVARARAAGLGSIWVRVGSSKDGFYGAPVLERLVPVAHQHGIAVVGWGFPYLADPAADAAWTRQALEWRSGPHRLDAFSPDIETGSEGVVLTERRVAAYLSLARPAIDGRPLVTTVYNPTDSWWPVYPYRVAAAYSDALAPMVYWGCRDPGADVERAIARLSPLAPVVPAGQAYDMGREGGRRHGHPTAEETIRFIDSSRRHGAVGVSFWVWQQAPAHQWDAIAAYRWPG